MTCLYVTEQGATLRKTGQTIVIEMDGKELAEIETARLNSILLYGNIHVTTPALKHLLENRIELALLSESGKIYGQLSPPLGKNIILRINQFKVFGDPDICLKLSRSLVMAKLTGAAEVLKQLSWNRRELDFGEPVHELERLNSNIPSVDDPETLNGLEGSAARIYFDAYARAFKNPHQFNGRSKRPPRDSANALMSFGYVLLASAIQSYLDAAGFDPYLGFYHRVEYGRPSLALDMLEVFRAPVVDRFVLKALNLGIFKEQDFIVGDDNGFRLRSEALKRFFIRWEENLRQYDFRKLLSEQAESLRAFFMKKNINADFHIFRAK